MKRSRNRTMQTSVDVKLKTGNDSSLSECLSNLENRDVNDLSRKINDVYQDIIRKSNDATSPSSDVVNSSMMDPKSTKLAIHFQKLAEAYRKNGMLNEARLYITTSIACAEADSKELASAYSDRSYILFRLGKYDCSIQDIKRAIEIANCPSGLKAKLRDRKKQCLMEQTKMCTGTDIKNNCLERRRKGNLVFSNSFLPNLSCKLLVEIDEEQGTRLIANEDIEPGEILFVDDFHVTALHANNCFLRCSFCLLLCDALIPCSTCTKEMYCSEDCRRNAFASFHKSECKFIRFYERDPHRTILAVRKFLIGTQHGKNLPNLMRELDSNGILVGKSGYKRRFDDYRSLLQIRDINQVEDIMEHVRLAVETIIVLRRSFFFGDDDTLPNHLGPVESFVASLLINHFVSITVGNGDIEILTFDHRFFPCDKCASSDTDLRGGVDFIGFGICLLYDSLVRQTHDANTEAYIQDRQRIAFATRTIRSGETLTANPCMFELSVQTWLNDFGCEERRTNFPKLAFRENEEISYLSPNFGREVTELMVKMKVVKQKALKLNKPLSNKELLNIVIENSKMLCKLLKTPCYDIVVSEQLLVMFMKVLYCDHYRQYHDHVLGRDQNQ